MVPYYHLIAANVRACLSPNCDLSDPEDCCLQFEGVAAKLIYDRPGEPGPGEVMNVYVSKAHIKRAVIERDDATLTPNEVKQHRSEVESSMLQGLHTWSKYKRFSRRPRNRGTQHYRL